MIEDLINKYLGIILGALALLAHAKGYFSSGEKPLTEKLKELEGKVDDHDDRILAIEGHMQHLPDRETINDLKLALSDISGRLNVLDERMKPIANTSVRLQDFLLEQAKR